MTGTTARAAVLAALLAGTAAMPAAAVTDARASESGQAEEAARKPDWLLLAVASVTFLIGRGAVQRRMKARSKPTP
jgi:hypothetical protein